MKLNIIKNAIDNGFSSEDDINEIEESGIYIYCDTDFLLSLDDDDLWEIMYYCYDDEYHNVVRKLFEQEPERILKMFSDSQDSLVNVLYNLNEEYWKISRIPSNLLKIVLDTLDEDDNKYLEVLKGSFSSEKEYFDFILANKIKIEEDVKELLDNHADLITKDIATSEYFVDLLDEYPETDNGLLYARTYDAKILALSNLLELLEYDTDVIDNMCRTYGIYEDSFDEDLMNAQIKKHVKDTKTDDRQNNRISVNEINDYLKENNIENVYVREGLIGPEDMSFDVLYIDGEEQGEIFNNRVWYNDRDFGDKQMSRTFFFECLKNHNLT